MEVNNQKIHWELIFFIKEFKEYVNIKDLIQLSLISKIIRLKLKPALFKCIELNNQNLSMRSNYFANEEDKWQMKNKSIMKKFISYSKRAFDRNTEFESSIIDPFVNNIKIELRAYQEYVKEFKFHSLEKACYYIFPIINIFTSLSKLTLFDAYINLNSFIDMMKALNNLKELKLKLVTFEKLSRSVSYNQEIFSQSLIELCIDGCTVSSSMLPNKPYEFLFDTKLEYNQFAIQFKPSYLPNLKILSLKSNDLPSHYINLWLKRNCQLLNISFNIINLREIEFDLIAQSHTLRSLEIEFLSDDYSNNPLDTPPLSSIQYLKISKIRIRYPIIREIILSCSNIVKLELDLTYCNEESIADLESRLRNLKSLSLNFCQLNETKFKIPNLIHANYLNINLSNNSVEEFILPKVNNLLLISISYAYKMVDIIEFREIHKSYTNWDINQNYNNILLTPNQLF